jgi:hypothetical protein
MTRQTAGSRLPPAPSAASWISTTGEDFVTTQKGARADVSPYNDAAHSNTL